METSRIDKEHCKGKVTSVLKEDVKRELLLFWGMHPNAKFSKSIIIYILDCNKRELETVLQAMVEAGLVETHIQNGVALYSLTTNEERRRPILEFARRNYDW